MDEKKYTHKVIMYDVNDVKRVAKFTCKKNAATSLKWMRATDALFYIDDAGTGFNLKQIVQINPVKLINKGGNES